MQKPEPAYPAYALSERIADGAMHFLGLTGALIGSIWLLIWAAGQVSGGQTAALAVYGVALIATFLASAIYHMTPWTGLRPILRRFDHAAIYLKIAGTYTPLVIMVGTLSSYFVLAIVWALAIFGMMRKLFFWKNPNRQGTALYLIMGWMSVALIGSLISILPTSALVLIAVGGGLYTLGVVFHVWESLKFSNAIWHGFVVAASACFFVAIALGVSGGLS